MRIERGRGLVKNDELQWVLGDGESAGNLHHLTLAEWQVAHRVAHSDIVPGENLVELANQEIAGPAAPAWARDRRVGDVRVLRHGEIGTERELLEYRADAQALAQHNGVAALGDPADHDAS